MKKPGSSDGARISYRDIGDYLSREQKLEIVARYALDTIEWQMVTPNAAGDWINQRNTAFAAFTAMGTKAGDKQLSVFRTYSGGLKTNRDTWVYNSSCDVLKANVGRMIEFYNSQVAGFEDFCRRESIRDPKSGVDRFIDLDPTKISWNRADRANVARGVRYNFHEDAITVGMYRPFSKHYVYFDRQMNDMIYRLPAIFPATEYPNFGFYNVGMGSAVPFSVLMIDALPDLHVTGAGSGGQFFPRYTYEQSSGQADLFNSADNDELTRVDNITDEILADYHDTYGPEVTKDDIFYYVYGLLHAPDYRAEFSSDLKKSLPRIPKVDDTQDFRGFIMAGRQLAELHLGYENVAPYPLEEVVKSGRSTAGEDLYRVQKMTFGKDGSGVNKSVILYNGHISLGGIPSEAYDYTLGSRSAIEWIMERYQVKTDRASGIVNDPNDWAAQVGDPRYILDLLKRIVSVSVETMKIVGGLPALVLTA